jgi:hypothetical protein
MEVNVDTLLEVRLKTGDDFLKIRETLTRIGVASRKEKKLYQSCHILHKRGRYYIVHFKELFALDGKPSNFDESDTGRRNTIARLLSDWGLLELITHMSEDDPVCPLSQIKILSYSDRNEWELVTKYSIGSKKKIS